jgi:hypothetical protein
MYAKTAVKVFVVIIAMISMGSMFACADRVFAPRDPYLYWYYPNSLVTDADRVIKDAERNCPKQLDEAKAAVDRAYEEYAACQSPVIRFECPPPPKVVTPAAPTCELKADKVEINPGESVTLSMTTSGNITSTDLEGTRDKTKTVSPTETKTYKGMVSGPGGSNQCNTVTVVVRKPKAPTCALTADREIVPFGESVKLTMTTSGDVTSAELDGKSVATTGGTKTIEGLKKGTRFTAKVDGPGGSNTCSSPISVSITLMVHFPFDRPKEMGNKKLPHDDPETWFDKPDAFDPKDALDPCNRKEEDLENRSLQDNKTLLQRAVEFVTDNPGTNIMVTGHTDCLGPKGREEEYNHELSHRRAQAVEAYIKKQSGLGNISIGARGLGFGEPVTDCDQYKQGKCDRAACDCRAKNRRVMVIASPR